MRDKPFDSLALVVDLETVAIADAAVYLEPATAPSNYKDPVKMAAYVQEKAAAQLATAALDCDLNRIVALGYRLEDRDLEPVVMLCPDEHQERQALITFWEFVACDANKTRTLIGFNAFGFDFPTLMRRSLYLDIETWRYLNVDKYRSPHIDLYQKLSFNGAVRAHSLRFYAQRFGFEIAAPELSGADIQARVEAGDWTAVRDHCASDVECTYQLACRLGYLEGDEDDDQEEVDREDQAS